MSFDMNPADEDEHGECRHEIERLNTELADARRMLEPFANDSYPFGMEVKAFLKRTEQ